MATIRNSITLQDRMTPVFRSIIKSMDSTLRVMKILDKQANKGVQSKAYQTAEKDIKRANNELIRMQNNLRRANQDAGKLSSTTGGISRNMSKMSSGGFNLTNLAAGLYILKNIANTMSSIMEIPDTLRASQYRLDTYDTTAATGTQLFDAAFVAAQRSRSEMESTASLASRILISGATGGSGADSINLAEILNKASFLGGSSAGESQRALLQLSQALASGTLQGDELRAIREQAPGLTDVLSKGLSSLAEKGLVPELFLNTTPGKLKSMGAEGELTAARVIEAFREMGTYVTETFESSPKQFGQSMTGISNIWKRWLKLMSEGDNGLAKINEKAWELLQWFQSAAGQNFMEGLANRINFVVDVIIGALDWFGALINKFNDLENASNALQAAVMALAIAVGIAAAYMAVKWIIAWVSAAWPVLLVIAIIGILIYALLEAGYTANEIVGGIAGGFMFLAYVLYDAVVWIVNIVFWAVALIWDAIVVSMMAIADLAIALGAAIILIIQAILQLILWVVTTIIGVFVTVYDVLYTIVKGVWGVIKLAIVGIYEGFVWMGKGVLSVLFNIASAIDKVFGSNLAGSVGGWMDGLDKSVDDLTKKLDPLGEFADIGSQWKNSYSDLGDMYAGNGKYDDMNLIDNMGEVISGASGMMDGVTDWSMGLILRPGMLNDWTLDNTINPMDGWDSGYNFGAGLADDLSKLDFSNALGDVSAIEGMLNNGIYVDGGKLDSLGSIKSDVDISEQDIQLLRDMAAREFLLNLQTITPTANITFGDVKETADVKKIISIIEDMVEEQLATSLVVGQ